MTKKKTDIIELSINRKMDEVWYQFHQYHVIKKLIKRQRLGEGALS